MSIPYHRTDDIKLKTEENFKKSKQKREKGQRYRKMDGVSTKLTETDTKAESINISKLQRKRNNFISLTKGRGGGRHVHFKRITNQSLLRFF